jgi:molybdenum cofactor synthesis domain-containing protein
MTTAAVIIIGDEILSGKYADENGPWLARRCRELGIDLVRISIIPDDVGTIAAEIQQCVALADYVFTTGGVGPTHDDVTMAGVAEAFSVPLVRNGALATLIQERVGTGVTAEAMTMADIPEGTVLWQTEGKRFPVLCCQRVLIFPGVPKYLRAKFDDIAHRLQGTPIQSRRLKTLQQESEIAACLRNAADRWKAVKIGSYPRLEEDPTHVIVTLDSRDQDSLNACESWLQGIISTAD